MTVPAFSVSVTRFLRLRSRAALRVNVSLTVLVPEPEATVFFL